MLTKEMVLQSLERMPTQFTVAELLEKIVLFSKIESGLKNIDGGKVHKHEDILGLIIRK
jgi:hypothetical protein